MKKEEKLWVLKNLSCYGLNNTFFNNKNIKQFIKRITFKCFKSYRVLQMSYRVWQCLPIRRVGQWFVSWGALAQSSYQSQLNRATTSADCSRWARNQATPSKVELAGYRIYLGNYPIIFSLCSIALCPRDSETGRSLLIEDHIPKITKLRG